ncbi:hypothetical protein ACXR0O_05880 [Verrucomicrobiota bacterium sgz303538]
MKHFVSFSIACITSLLFAGELRAQSGRLDVRVLGDAASDTRMSQMVRNGTKVDSNAPKLRLEATVSTPAGAPFQATVEWYVLGRVTEEGKQAGRTAAEMTLMQASKEAVTVKPLPGSKTTFIAYQPGQVRNGARSEGWIARLVNADGKVIDEKASTAPFLTLGRDQARLDALLATKAKAETAGANGDVDLPLEVLAQIKAEAEKHWPGNPEMQAYEIKNKVDAHKAAYRK